MSFQSLFPNTSKLEEFVFLKDRRKYVDELPEGKTKQRLIYLLEQLENPNVTEDELKFLKRDYDTSRSVTDYLLNRRTEVRKFMENDEKNNNLIIDYLSGKLNSSLPQKSGQIVSQTTSKTSQIIEQEEVDYTNYFKEKLDLKQFTDRFSNYPTDNSIHLLYWLDHKMKLNENIIACMLQHPELYQHEEFLEVLDRSYSSKYDSNPYRHINVDFLNEYQFSKISSKLYTNSSSKVSDYYESRLKYFLQNYFKTKDVHRIPKFIDGEDMMNVSFKIIEQLETYSKDKYTVFESIQRIIFNMRHRISVKILHEYIKEIKDSFGSGFTTLNSLYDPMSSVWDYLETYFRRIDTATGFKQLKRLLKLKYTCFHDSYNLKSIFAEQVLQKGEKLDEYKSYLSSCADIDFINKCMDKKILSFVNQGQMHFYPLLDVFRIPKLTIRIFKLNVSKILKQKIVLDGNLNFDAIDIKNASDNTFEELNIEFETLNRQYFDSEHILKEIMKKGNIYAIEFICNEDNEVPSLRTYYSKGYLSPIIIERKDHQEISVLNEEGEFVDFSIIIDSKTYDSDENKMVLLPFVIDNSPLSTSSIIYDSSCENLPINFSFDRIKMSRNFTMQVVHTEPIADKNVNFTFYPNIEIITPSQKRNVSLNSDFIQDFTVTIMLMDDDIQLGRTIHKVEEIKDMNYTHKLPFDCNFIRIEAECKINAGGYVTTHNYSHDIFVKNQVTTDDAKNFFDYELLQKNNKSKVRIHAKRINGERLPFARVTGEYSSKYLDKISFDVKTNKNGWVDIPLEDHIYHLVIDIGIFKLPIPLYLNGQGGESFVSSKTKAITKNILKPEKDFYIGTDLNFCSILDLQKNKLLSNKRIKRKDKHNMEHIDYFIDVNDFVSGHEYRVFYLLPGSASFNSINLNVFLCCMDDDILFNKSKIQSLKVMPYYVNFNSNSYIQGLLDISNDDSINIQLLNMKPNSTVYCYSSHLLTEAVTFERTDGQIKMNNNDFNRFINFSDRKLDEEIRYVMQRRKEGHRLGNTLPQPTNFIAPRYIKDTENKSIDFNEGKNLQKEKQYHTSAMTASRSAKLGGSYSVNKDYSKILPFISEDEMMKLVGCFSSKTDDEKELNTFNIPLANIDKSHSYIIIIYHDYETGYLDRLVFNIPTRGLNAFRDISLQPEDGFGKKLFGETKLLSLEAEVNCTNMVTLNGWSDFVNLCNNTTSSCLSESMLMNWFNLSLKEKMKQFEQNYCTELCFLLWVKDYEFFKQRVLEFLINKPEKTYLERIIQGIELKEHEDLMKLFQLKFDDCNLIEQGLLITIFGSQVQRTNFANMHEIEARKLFNLHAHQLNSLFASLMNPANDTYLPPPSNEFEPQPQMRSFGGAMNCIVSDELSFSAQRFECYEEEVEDDIEEEEELEESDSSSDEEEMIVEKKKRSRRSDGSNLRESKGLGIAPVAREFSAVAETKIYAETGYKGLTVDEGSPKIPKSLWLVDWLKHLSNIEPSQIRENICHFSEGLLHSITTKTSPEFILALSIPTVSLVKTFQEFESPVASDFVAKAFIVDSNGNRVKECLLGYKYEVEIIIINTGKNPERNPQLLFQIPIGSIRLDNPKKADFITLERTDVSQTSFSFFTMKLGETMISPVTISLNDELVCHTEPLKFNIVNQLSTPLEEMDWRFVADHSSDEEILEFVSKNTVRREFWRRINGRFYNKDFWLKCYPYLVKYNINEDYVYAFINKFSKFMDITDVMRVIERQSQLDPEFLGYEFKTEHISRDRLFLGKIYQHEEFRPYINARIHALKDKDEFQNQELKVDYEKLLNLLVLHSKPYPIEYIHYLVYFLVLLDRKHDAKQVFDMIDTKEFNNEEYQLQNDYLTVYFAFEEGNIDFAHEISNKYVNYPIPRWAERWNEVNTQIQQILVSNVEKASNGDKDAKPDELSGKDSNTDLAMLSKQREKFKIAPYFTMTLKKSKLLFDTNIDESIILKFHELDAEMTFSLKPFVFDNSSSSNSKVESTASILITNNVVELPPRTTSYQLEEKKPYIIIATCQAINRQVTFLPHDFSVVPKIETGVLRVVRNGKPVPKAYVKVYHRKSVGDTGYFRKDGFTDLGGRFDYASVSIEASARHEKYAVFIITEDGVCNVVYVDPPSVIRVQ
eukprot:TRINITY_DN1395_c0_g1_i1.p1 TRINITY_DN1395_c0_g1~~TRINITY_DN1395_c0_g1_i1.p1  ORF type:complete len:2139 (-),score=626.92 TRINITY_DN1395_c0_g1_i1:679-7095(-)